VIGGIIYGALVGNATVAALVGTRVYPEEAPDKAAMPFIVYTVGAGEFVDGSAAMWQAAVTISCYAATDSQAETLRAACDAVLEGYNGQDASYLARGLWRTDYSEVRDAEFNLWGRLATYQGWIVRR
jgi:hypothetical protein